MNFRQFLEASDELFRSVYSLGETPRDEIEKLINQKRNQIDIGDFYDRDVFTRYFGWSIPCKEAVDSIKKYAHEPLYDVMAGTGYWAKVLRKAGMNVIASDIHRLTEKNPYHRKREELSPGQRDVTQFVKPEKERVLRRNALKVGYDLGRGRLRGDVLISWPPYQRPFATDLLEMLPIGARVFYIGEGGGGCTGDASFHHYLCVNFKELHQEYLPNWPGIHDRLWIYEKEKNNPIDPKYRGKVFSWDTEDEEEQE